MQLMHKIGIAAVLSCWMVTAQAGKGLTEIPSFVMTEVSGEKWTQKKLEQSDLSVLVFFKAKCKSCVQTIKHLNAAKSKVKGAGFSVFAIGKDDIGKLKTYAADNNLDIPVLHADKAQLKAFKAQYVFPTVYIIGKDRKVLDFVQGGGHVTDQMLLTLAERQMQKNQFASASFLYKEVSPGEKSATASSGLGHSLIKAGKVDEAKKVFEQLSANTNPAIASQGQSGLSELAFSEGRTSEALTLANNALKGNPNNVSANLVKAKTLFQQGKKGEAEQAIKKATVASSEFKWQKAEALLAKGNIARGSKRPEIALASYKEAVAQNPFYAEAMSNQSVVLMDDLKQPEKALELLKKASTAQPNDRLVHAFMRQAQAAIAQKQDIERQKYINTLVGDLLTQFKANKKKKAVDTGTSPVMAVSVLGFQTDKNGMLMGRLGLEGVLQETMIHHLKNQNVNVVDRSVIDKVMEELKLGSGDLADQDTQLKLGKIMAARIIAVGSVFQKQKGGLASMRLIDTETTQIVASFSQDFKVSDAETITELYAKKTRALLDEKYPLHGLVVEAEADLTIINLGSKHGAAVGMVFNVVKEGKPIKIGDRILGYRKTTVAKIEITEVDKLFSYVKVIEKKGTMAKNLKVLRTLPKKG
ncbi:MAG: tetratricopeptide repeat protein [Methylococcales bacterium]|jgi:tetratricopeptide (TPR) repeat protein|nr:tetratricopeptide repeat protein [Methylococcales bacterium]MBT7443178.1 tetratricopeptide repeat protein [Methylococcales bacterium]